MKVVRDPRHQEVHPINIIKEVIGDPITRSVRMVKELPPERKVLYPRKRIPDSARKRTSHPMSTSTTTGRDPRSRW